MKLFEIPLIVSTRTHDSKARRPETAGNRKSGISSPSNGSEGLTGERQEIHLEESK